MHSEIHVDIHGDIDRVYALASAVERWPAILPHYRYVTVIQESREAPPRRIVEMSARRGPLPARWLAVVEPVPAERRILFQHIGGAARGMEVEWRIVQHDGFVRATISHRLDASPYAIVRSRFGESILGEQFINPIAGRTLGRIKHLVEAEAAQ
ncbi:MAG: hypothetical protein M3Q65_14855 [Chloroflexota bacterium]|nr:hypothetical protein [Chloroflexota bacterium]